MFYVKESPQEDRRTRMCVCFTTCYMVRSITCIFLEKTGHFREAMTKYKHVCEGEGERESPESLVVVALGGLRVQSGGTGNASK